MMSDEHLDQDCKSCKFGMKAKANDNSIAEHVPSLNCPYWYAMDTKDDAMAICEELGRTKWEPIEQRCSKCNTDLIEQESGLFITNEGMKQKGYCPQCNIYYERIIKTKSENNVPSN